MVLVWLALVPFSCSEDCATRDDCSTYEVATACAIALQADKLLVLLDGPILDENGRHLRFMTLDEADKLIRKRASQSYAAADYVKAVAGPAYVQSLGIPTSKSTGYVPNGKGVTSNGRSMNGAARDAEIPVENGALVSSKTALDTSGGGFAIGGEERLSRTYGYLSELTAAVYVCRVSFFLGGFFFCIVFVFGFIFCYFLFLCLQSKLILGERIRFLSRNLAHFS